MVLCYFIINTKNIILPDVKYANWLNIYYVIKKPCFAKKKLFNDRLTALFVDAIRLIHIVTIDTKVFNFKNGTLDHI